MPANGLAGRGGEGEGEGEGVSFSNSLHDRRLLLMVVRQTTRRSMDGYIGGLALLSARAGSRRTGTNKCRRRVYLSPASLGP